MKKYYIYITLLLVILLTSCGDKDGIIAVKNPTVPTENSDIISQIETSQITPDVTDNNMEKSILLTQPIISEKYPNIDVDLTKLSSTMVYSEVYNMMYTPEDYVGKIVRAHGTFNIYQDVATDKNYYAVLISDAASCCIQGLEFVLADDTLVYPTDYPQLDQEIVVTGIFSTYEENELTYITLLDTEIIFN